jgi:hypothetical protein
MAELGDGAIFDGKFDNSGDFKLKQDRKWTALYDPESRRAMLAWYPTPLAGQGIKAGYWDKPVYHKLYNQIYSHATEPAGTKFEAAVILGGIESDAAAWKDAARTRAADTKARFEHGEIHFLTAVNFWAPSLFGSPARLLAQDLTERLILAKQRDIFFLGLHGLAAL